MKLYYLLFLLFVGITQNIHAKSIEIGEPTVTAWDTPEVNGGEVTPVTPSVK